jgi:hypothetical protein
MLDGVDACAEDPGQDEVDGGYQKQREEGVKGAGADVISRLGNIHDGYIAHNGCGLDEGGSLCPENRQNVKEGLRQDYFAKYLSLVHPQGGTGFPLPFLHAGNPGAENLGKIGPDLEC